MVPAAWPISIVDGCRRKAPAASRVAEMFLSPASKPSTRSGMKDSNGIWNGPPTK